MYLLTILDFANCFKKNNYLIELGIRNEYFFLSLLFDYIVVATETPPPQSLATCKGMQKLRGLKELMN